MGNHSHIRLAAALTLLRRTTRIDTLERLHGAVESEIKRSCQVIEKVHEKNGEELADAVIDEECEHIEELLGLAFICAQSFINSVRTQMIRFNETYQDALGLNLKTAPEPLASELLKKAKLVNRASEFTVVEAIDAVANYWKHSEEWPTHEAKSGKRLITVWDVEAKPGIQARTIQIVSRIGLSPGSTGNLRQAAATLGAGQYDDLSPIRIFLRDWADSLYKTVATKVTAVIKPQRGA